jgi:hypothetical protein
MTQATALASDLHTEHTEHIDQRVRLRNISWEDYEALLAMRGESSGKRGKGGQRKRGVNENGVRKRKTGSAQNGVSAKRQRKTRAQNGERKTGSQNAQNGVREH